jgi:putative DNA primase/helicase
MIEIPEHATLADAARVIDEAGGNEWWDGYVRRGEVHLVVGKEKVGKTNFLTDLAARCWFGNEFPLGHPCPVPPGSSTLWCLGDRQHQQLRDRLDAARVPLDAVHLAAPRASPLGFWRLDDEDSFASFVHLAAALAGRIAFTVIDTAWSAAPSYKLHDTGDVASHFGRLADLAAKTQVPVLVTNHLNRENGVLGIRSSGIARTILKLTRVDPNDRSRLRLDVDGNYKPVAPLGLTITDVGIDYSSDAPDVVEGAGTGKPGPKQTARKEAREFLLAELTRNNDQKAVDLVNRWVEGGGNKATLFNAKTDLADEDRLVVEDSRKPQLWHLVAETGDTSEAEWF